MVSWGILISQISKESSTKGRRIVKAFLLRLARLLVSVRHFQELRHLLLLWTLLDLHKGLDLARLGQC